MSRYSPLLNYSTRLLTAIIFIISPLLLNAQSWDEKSVLKALKQEVNDYLGTRVAVSENYAAASGEKGTGDSKWPVYIHKRNSDNTFSFVQGVQSSDPEYLIKVSSLAMTDDLLVVGAAESGPFLSSGVTFVFEKDGSGVWNEVQRLSPSDPHGLDDFGSAVAISNNTIVVSSPGKSIEWKEGAIYVFERGEDGKWYEHQKMMTDDYYRDDHLGFSLAIEGDVILAGAPYENENNQETFAHGAVYFFKRNAAGTWEQKQKIVSPNRAPSSAFGWSLDIYGDEAIIGAEMENHYGAVYFFKREGDTWAFKQRIASPAENSFAHDVALDDDIAVVSLGDHLAKYAFSYKRQDDGTWIDNVKIYGPPFTNFEAERFGNDIDLKGDMLIIGAPDANSTMYNDYNPPRAGEAHVYKMSIVPPAFERVPWLEANADVTFPALIDFDNDGDLDLFVSYRDDNVRESRLYRFEQNQFTLTTLTFPYLEYNSSVEWIDVNSDGWLDLLMTSEQSQVSTSLLFINNEGQNFTDSNVSDELKDDLWTGHFYFADYDNDSDPDLLAQANMEFENNHVIILQNDGNFNFTETGLTFEGIIPGKNAWFDYNNDGLKDFYLVSDECEVPRITIYKNNGVTFESQPTGVNALAYFYYNHNGEILPVDYDNDGDEDLIWAGMNSCSNGDGGSDIITNNDGLFASQNKPFRSLILDADLFAADFDHDGRLDLMAYGDPRVSNSETTFFLQSANGFEKLMLYEMPRSYQFGGVAGGDIEGDGDIDVVIAGEVQFLKPETFVYKNNATEGWATENEAPSAPLSLSVDKNDNEVQVHWVAPFDDATPTNALTYNIRLVRNDSIIVGGNSMGSGVRQIYTPGNVGHNTTIVFRNLKPGDYQVFVQAIDNSYHGSEFTPAAIFKVEVEVVTATEQDNTPSISLYPNPTDNEVVIESSTDDLTTVTICDARGCGVGELKNINDRRVKIDLRALNSGVYIVTMQLKKGAKAYKKIIKR